MCLLHTQTVHLNVYYPVPGPPTNVMITPPPGSCDKLEFSWTAQANPGELPVNYTLYLDEYPPKVINTIDKLVIMNGLTANTEYTVTVVAVNELGEGRNVTGTGRTRPEGLGIFIF